MRKHAIEYPCSRRRNARFGIVTQRNPNAIYHYAIQLVYLLVARRATQTFLDPLGFSEKSLTPREIIEEYKKVVVIQLKRAVELEHVESMNALAMKYSSGEGCEKDPDAAFELVSKSESTGSVLGISLLADCTAKGIGTKSNPRPAATLYAKATKLGSPIAQYKYELCFANGFGVTANMAACNQWMTTSASNACQYAAEVRKVWLASKPAKQRPTLCLRSTALCRPRLATDSAG